MRIDRYCGWSGCRVSDSTADCTLMRRVGVGYIGGREKRRTDWRKRVE